MLTMQPVRKCIILWWLHQRPGLRLTRNKSTSYCRMHTFLRDRQSPRSASLCSQDLGGKVLVFFNETFKGLLHLSKLYSCLCLLSLCFHFGLRPHFELHLRSPAMKFPDIVGERLCQGTHPEHLLATYDGHFNWFFILPLKSLESALLFLSTCLKRKIDQMFYSLWQAHFLEDTADLQFFIWVKMNSIHSWSQFKNPITPQQSVCYVYSVFFVF